MSRLKAYRIGPPYGGVNKMLAEHVIGDDTATITDNWTLRSKGLTTVNGWEQFTSQVLTDGAENPSNSTILLIDQFFKNDGSSYLIGFTNNRVYQYSEAEDVWFPITPGADLYTFVDTDSAAARKTLSVDSVSGYQVGDTIIINEGGPREEHGVVDSINSSGTVTPSDTVRYSDDTSENEFDIDEYTLVKSIEITADITGEERFTFDMQTSYSGYTSYARIYKNGSPLGTEQSSTSESYEEKSEDITENFVTGDTVELWVNTNGDEMHGTYVQNFRIKYDGGTVSLDLLDNLTYEHTAVQADVVRRTYGSAIVDADSASGQTVLNVSHTDQFTDGEDVIIGLGTSAQEIRTIASITADTSLTMEGNLENTHTAALADKVYRMQETSLISEAGQVDTDNNNDIYYFTDGVNAIQTYTASGAPSYHSDLEGLSQDSDGSWPSVKGIGTISTSLKAKYIRSFYGFLIIGNLTEEGTVIPNKIRWSQIDTPTKWDNETDDTGQAGSLLFSGPDFIIGMHQMKRELLIYRERSIEAMSYVGLPNIFGFRRAETGTGLVAPRAIADFGDKHVFAGPDNIWEYNGISLVAIGDAIKDDFFDTVNPSQLGNVAMFFIEETDELWLTYSTTGNFVHDKAYIYNTIFQKWSGPRDIDGSGYGYYRQQTDSTWDTLPLPSWDALPINSWDSREFLANAPLNMAGNDDGLVFVLDRVATADGSTISKRYESKRLDLGNGHLLKQVQRLRVSGDVSGDPTINIYLGVAMSSNDEIAWNGPYQLDLTDNANPYVYMDLHGRFFKVRVDTDANLTLDDIEVQFYQRAEI